MGEDDYKVLLMRLGYLGLGVIFVAVATSVFGSNGYTDPLVAAFETLVVGIGIYYIIRSISGINQTTVSLIPIISPAIFLIAVILIWGVSTQPVLGTDETALSYGAALLFIHGINPYLPNAMTNVFTHLNFDQILITPLRTGGIVTIMPYPALAFLLFVPTTVLNLRPEALIAVSALAFPILIYFQYYKQNMLFLVPVGLFILLADFDYISYSAGGLVDMPWVVFVALAIYYMLERQDAKMGMFLGLATSVKLLPIFIIPFMLWFAYKEKQNTRRVLGSLITTVVIINGYFLIISPSNFVTSVLSPETLPLIGIGMGLSQWAFSGAFFLPPWFFSAYLGVAFIACLVIYIRFYTSMKWAFFIFPLIVTLLNFRVLGNYVIYWPLFMLIILPYLWEHQHAPHLKGEDLF